VIQLDIVNVYPFADRQAQIDVLSRRASESCDIQVGDNIPRPSSLYHYWSYFESMQGTASTLHFNDYQGQAHKIVCSKRAQQGDAFETVRFAVTNLPDFGQVLARHVACTGAAISDVVFIIAPLADGLTLAAELKQVLKQDLDLDVPNLSRWSNQPRRLCTHSFPKCSAGQS